MKKLFGSLFILCIIITILFSPTIRSSYAITQNNLKSDVLLPNFTDITKKNQLNKLKDIASKSKNPQKDIKDYLLGLSKDDLLLTIAEASDELRNSNDLSSLEIFSEATSKKLLDSLTDE